MKQLTRFYLSLVILLLWSTGIWASPACTAEYTINAEDGNHFTASVVVINQRKKLPSWKVAWKMPNGQRITQLYNGRYRQKKAAVTVKNLPGFGKTAAGANIAFDFEASYTGDNTSPSAISLNGKKCAIVKAPPTAGIGCTVDYRIAEQWNNGFTAAVAIKNNAPLTGWKLAWDMPGNQKITYLWNGLSSQKGSHVEVVNADWNKNVAGGAGVEFGFNGSYASVNSAPNHFSLNGMVCELANNTGTPIPTSTPIPTPSPTPSSMPTQKPTATPSPAPTVKPTVAPSPTPTLMPTPSPSPIPTQKPTATPTPVPSARCEVNYQVSAQWNTGFTAAVKIRNTASAWSAWKLVWDMPDGQKITNSWNGQYVQNAAHVEVDNAGWNGRVANGANVDFGFQGTHTGTNRIPGTFSLNGNICSIAAADGGSSNTVVPSVPAGFTSTVIDNASVVLSWTDQSSNETGFQVERRNPGAADWTSLATTAANVESYTDSEVAMGSDYEYRLSAVNAVGSSADLVLPVSIPSLLDYGKLQYQRQSCGGCHGIDGNGGIASALTKHVPADLNALSATIAATMPPPADPAQCTGNCALGTARYITEVLTPAGNGGTGNSQACAGNPPPGTRSLRLLTRQEYQNTVNDLLGLSANLIYQLPDENRVDGFDNNSATNQVTSIRLEAYLAQADTLASQAVLQNRAQLVPCNSQTADCAQQFIGSFGKRAYRRPLTAEETADFLNNFANVSFNDAVTTTISQMLVSPYFLYRSELGELQADGSYKLTPYETASALSYLFLGSMPDAALFAAADQNQLDTPEQRLTQAARLLGMPQSRQQLGNFVGQWLLSSSPYTLPEKDKTVYPRYTADVKAALSGELIAFFNYVAFDSSQSFQELFSANYVLANKTLADYYGLTGPNGSAYQVTPVSDGSRTGLLTLGAVLSRYANSNESHPFKRGGFLYKRLLCHDLPPPANMGLIIAPKQDPDATTRERFAFHSSSNASCYSCHQYLDEPGFGFENYDGAGGYRTLENGQAIATAGTLRGLETFTPTETVAFSNLQEISDLIAGSPQAAQCVARQYYRYGTGRREQPADSCALDSFIQTYANNGYNLQTMLLGIVNAPGFNLRSGSGL